MSAVPLPDQVLEREPEPETWAALRDRQAGVVSRAQAARHGYSDERVARLLAAGLWQRLHPGVYLTTAAVASHRCRIEAGLLYAGDGAAASHDSALWLQVPKTAEPGLVHVTVDTRRRVRPQPGLVIHRSIDLTAARVHPLATPRRVRLEPTVFDVLALPRIRSESDVIALLSRVVQSGRTRPDLLRSELARRGRQRWRAVAAEALADVAAGAESPLEVRHRRARRRHGLPPGRRQVVVAKGQRVDVLDEEFAVVSELDGRLGHEDQRSRWRDMDRDNASALAGRLTLRFGWLDVTTRECEMAAQTAALLAARGWSGPLRPCGPTCTAAAAPS